MAAQLLIRLFDVGLGDCIYCRIPDSYRNPNPPNTKRDFHILIDCGSLSGSEYLKQAIDTLKPMLPEENGKRRIDLLVHGDSTRGCREGDRSLGNRAQLGLDYSPAPRSHR